jgi:hypothetical protein
MEVETLLDERGSGLAGHPGELDHFGPVHERGGFRLGVEDGRPVFRRPDGSVLEERAPP